MTTLYNSMGLAAKLSSSLGGDLVDGTLSVNAVSDAVNYDEAGRLRNLRFAQGGNLWQSYYYFAWGGTDGNSNGRLWYIGLSTSVDGYERMLLDYRYDSFGNVSQHNPNNGVWNNFTYDQQNRLTNGYGRTYGYDAAGRMTNYESAVQSFHPYRPHAMSPNWNNYGVDLNGNFVARVQNGVVQTLTWDHQNRLVSVTGTGINESYLYDADGQRVKKTSNGSATYYPNQFYEQYGTNVDKYYYFNGQPIALRRNGTLYYMHQDQIGNLALVTNNGVQIDAQGFYAYGRLRSGIIGVERSFTGQQKDAGTGLIYFNARYYDPEIGTFISPDTVVPDAGNLFDYNRYMFVRGNPLKYNDPDGHQACAAAAPIPFIAVGCQIGELAMRYGPLVVNQVSAWVDKLPGAVDWLFNSSNAAEQGANSAGQQNAGNSASGDPGDPFGFNRFSKLARDKGFQGLQRDLQSSNTGNRVGAERTLRVMEKLGDKVQNVNQQFKGLFRGGDIDIIETTGNIHSIGDHTQKAGYLGGHFQYLQQFVAQSSNPNATITYWFTGDPNKLESVQREATKWGVLVEVLK